MTAIHAFTALMDSFAGTALVGWLFKLTLLTAVACAYMTFARRAQPALRHAVAVGSLLAVVLLPVASKLLPTVSVPVLPASGEAAYPVPVAVGDPEPFTIDVASPRAEAAPLTVGAIDAPETGSVVSAPARPAFISRAMDFAKEALQVPANWIRLGLVLWMMGTLALLVRLGLQVARASGIARRAVPASHEVLSVQLERACRVLRMRRRPDVVLSSEITIPIVCGAARSRIVMPTGSPEWSHQRLGIVLLHEIAHIRRRDCAWMWFAEVVRAVLWFHPLVVILTRHVRRESERACDALVLAAGVRGSDYAGHLVSIAAMSTGRSPLARATLAFAARSTLEERVSSILAGAPRRVSARLAGAAVVVALTLFVTIAVAQPTRGVFDECREEQQRYQAGKAEFQPSVQQAMESAQQVQPMEIQLAHGGSDDDDEGEEWYDRAHSYYQRERWEKAGSAYENAARLGYNRATAFYNAGCSYALAGQADKAIEMLQEAFDEGFEDLDMYASDDDLNSLRDDARFKKLMGAVMNTDEADQRRRQAGREYDRLAARKDVDEGDWNDVGIELLRAGDYDRAAIAFDNEFKASKNTSEDALYNKACARSLGGRTDEALKLLEQSIITGPVSAEHMEDDADLLPLHKNERFGELVKLAEDLELDHGDFSIGNWSWNGKKSKHSAADEEAHWKKAVPRFTEVANRHPKIGRAWSNLGYAQLKAADAKASAPSFQKALDFGYRPPTTMYNLACAHAQTGNVDSAFAWLDKSEQAGFDVWQYARWDEDLDPLRADPRWKAKKSQWKDRERDHADAHEVHIHID